MPLILIALGWCVGIAYAAGERSDSLLVWVAAPLPLYTAYWLIRQRHARMFLMIALAFALGGLRFALAPATSAIAAFNNYGGATVEGIVIAPPDAREDRQQIRISADSITQNSRTYATNGIVMIDAPRWIDVRYGDHVRATGTLTTPSRYGNFSYADYLARAGIYSQLRDASVEILAADSAANPFTILLDLRRRAADQFARSLPEPESGLLTGILLGDESSIADSTEDAFALTGAAHIVAISGFNMVVVSGIVTGLLKRLRAPRRLSTLLALAAIAVYTLFVGASAAVLRAALMSGLLIVGKNLRRKTFVPTSLAFAALILSAVNPLTLWDVGFQLSFAAVLGIALFTDPLQNRFSALLSRLFPKSAAARLSEWLAEPLIVSLSATVAVLPLIILLFGRVSWVTLFVNVLIVPVQPLILILGGAAAISGWVFPPLAAIFHAGVFILLAYTIDVVRFFAALPFASTEIAIHKNSVALLFGAVVVVTMIRAVRPSWASRVWQWIKQRRILSLIGAALAALVILGIAYVRAQPDGRLHVWLLDMGHAHAALIRTPGGATILLDGGRYPTRLLTLLGDRLPFYSHTIDLLMITHPDPNDYTALLEVAERYTIGAAITNGQPNGNPAYAALLDSIGLERVTPAPEFSGDRITLPDGTRIEILNPITSPSLSDSFGESALVLRVTLGDTTFLFPSDLDADGQAVLLEQGIDPEAQVLIVPRRGGEDALSAEFLRAVNPSLALIQLDPANYARDPAPETLEMLTGIPVYRTDQVGTIHIVTDGSSLWEWAEGD